MRSILRLLAITAFTAFAAMSTAQTALTISFDLGLDSGDDSPYNFDGSNWSFLYTFDSGQTYVDLFGSSTALASTGQLTVSGGSDFDGTYTIADGSADSFMFMPNRSGGSLLLWDSGFSGIDYAFSTVSVAGPSFNGSVVASEPSVGALIEASHFDGITTSSSFQFRVDSGPRYSFSDATVSASAVPEPGTYATLAGLAVLGFVTQRRRRCSTLA